MNFVELLNYIPPDCPHDEWLSVGMALKHEGLDVSVWDQWSRGGSKYHDGECEKRWHSFREQAGTIVTGGTIYHLAKNYGYVDDTMRNDYDIHNLWLEPIIDPAFVSRETVPQPPSSYDPKADMREYFTTLFNEDEYVGYCVKCFKDAKDNKWKPARGTYSRKAGDILQRLETSSIEMAIGTTNDEAGAYVRFNPLDGKGESNANVTRYTYCLVESDVDEIGKQYGMLKAMNLPIELLVSSGSKSLHAIVHVDAVSAGQYRERVNKIYEFCKANGYTPDEQDKNESRYSRLPGVKRNGKWQYIVDRHMGAKSYDEWLEWVEEQVDDLPKDATLEDVWNNMPPLKEELIPGILRVGHKLLLSGPSKAGKSYMLMNLAVSLAEGIEWLGQRCRQGKVAYVNLELDEASCYHRFKEIYSRRHLEPKCIKNIHIWNLRGHSVPMNKLAPILIHRFKDKGFEAVIIDPIYKVITGDENNATDMSEFCSYFDRVATEMGVATIYCHHHSKGARGKYANAMDRSSGSGVFARDPDAILDLSELNVNKYADRYRKQVADASETLTGWEMTGTLREFPPMRPLRLWFDYPIHVADDWNFLSSAKYMDVGSKGAGRDEVETDVLDGIFNLLAGDGGVVEREALKSACEYSEKQLEKRVGINTRYEAATTNNDDKLIILRDVAEFTYKGKRYERKNMKNRKWVENE